MGAAFYVVVDAASPGFDTTIDGKALARNSSQIDSIAASLGFKALADYCSMSPEQARDQMAELLGIEDVHDLPEGSAAALSQMPPEEWFDPALGRDYAMRIAEYVRKNLEAVRDADAILNNLHRMEQIMAEASERGLKWHLLVDY